MHERVQPGARHDMRQRPFGECGPDSLFDDDAGCRSRGVPVVRAIACLGRPETARASRASLRSSAAPVTPPTMAFLTPPKPCASRPTARAKDAEFEADGRFVGPPEEPRGGAQGGARTCTERTYPTPPPARVEGPQSTEITSYCNHIRHPELPNLQRSDILHSALSYYHSDDLFPDAIEIPARQSSARLSS
jgi:hypothetical protein